MKYVGQILTLILPLALTSAGSPIQKEQIAADAKWLVHLDVDKLRSTTVGDYVIKQVLNTKLGALTRQFDFDLDWNKVNSLTAYGSAFQSKSSFDGVVLIKTELDLRKPLDAAIEQTLQENGNKRPPIQKTQEGQVTTYSLKDNIFASFQSGRPVIVGKSLDSIRKAGEVLSGTSANLASTKTFSEFPKSQKSFFLLGAVKAFNPNPGFPDQGGDGETLNPKAKILKLADSGRVVLGEDANQLFLDLSLKAKSAEVVTQIQQVIQGMIALASLSQLDNQDLQQLAESAKVSSAGTIVSLKLGYPADQAVLLLSSNLNRHLEGRKRAEGSEGHKKKVRSKTNDTAGDPDKTDEQ